MKKYINGKIKESITKYDLKNTKKILNLKDKLGRLKMPKLVEIYKYLYPSNNIDESKIHDAEYDVKITRDCFIKIKEKNIILN